MQTARANIRNPNNGLKENVRLLLDSGRQNYCYRIIGQEDEPQIGKEGGDQAGNIWFRHT